MDKRNERKNEIYEPNFTEKTAKPISVQVRFRKLFIGGIVASIDENDIKEYFEEYGKVTGCTIHRDRDSGRSRGFGFITFEDPATVDAVQENRPHVLNGCEVTLKRAVPKELFQEFDGLLTVNRMFIGGLKQETQEDDIREYFEKFGTVRKVDVMLDRTTNVRRGFAFVEFDDYDPVDKVVLRGSHVIQGQVVSVRKAKSRLEMELLKQRKGFVPPDVIPPLLRRKSMNFQDSRSYGPPLAAFPRSSLGNIECPFHFENRRRRYF